MNVLSLNKDYEIILAKISEKIRERFDRSDNDLVDSVITFSRHLYSRSPLEELAGKRIEDLYGATVTLWDFTQH